MYATEGSLVKKNRSKKSYTSWQEEYESKLCSAADAAAIIQSNDKIAMSGGTSVPYAFSRELSKRAGQISHVTLSMGYAMALFDYMKPENRESFHLETVFVGPMERICMDWGVASYVPVHLGDTGGYTQHVGFNRVTSAVCPPDEDGYMSRSLFASFLDNESIRRAETVIVEVNKNIPRLNSEDFRIHVSEVDFIIENHEPIFEVPEIPITDVERKIAAYIADMVPDESTIQLGFGGLGNAIGYLLMDKKNLGMHTEVVSPSVMELVKAGVINGSRKNFMPNKVVAGFCVGTREFYDYINENTDYIFKEIGWINNPMNIAKNDNLVSINNAIMFDLTGQAASESIGIKQYSGTGGQVNFVMGSKYSKGGKSIMSLSSTYKDKEGKLQSKILATLPPNTVVTTSRNDIQYVVTEHGVANLKFKSLEERAKQLISIAHPDFRDKLKFEAHKNGWL